MGWCHKGARAARSALTVAPLGRPSGLGDTEEGPTELLRSCLPLFCHYHHPPTPSSHAGSRPSAPSLPSLLLLQFHSAHPPPHLTLASEPPLLQPGPDALDAARVLRVPAVVSTGALVLQHDRVIHQPCGSRGQSQDPREFPVPVPAPPQHGTRLGTHTPHPILHLDPSHEFTPPAAHPGSLTTSHAHQQSPTFPTHGPSSHGHCLFTTSRTQSLTKGGPMLGSHTGCIDSNRRSQRRKNSTETPKLGGEKPRVIWGHVTRQMPSWGGSVSA